MRRFCAFCGKATGLEESFVVYCGITAREGGWVVLFAVGCYDCTHPVVASSFLDVVSRGQGGPVTQEEAALVTPDTLKVVSIS